MELCDTTESFDASGDTAGDLENIGFASNPSGPSIPSMARTIVPLFSCKLFPSSVFSAARCAWFWVLFRATLPY
jgi:hypothetical protein